MVAPIVSSSLMAVGIDCCSNMIAQRLRAWRKEEPFVFDRLLFVQFLIMVVLTAPFNFLWQNWLERTFPGWKVVKRRDVERHSKSEDVELGDRSNDAKDGYEHKRDDSADDDVRVRNWFNIFRKWFTDCITLGALFNTVAFLIIMGNLKGKSWTSIGSDLRNETWKIIWNSYKVWPIANFFSTTYCPVEKRIVFLSCCGLIWNIYLSLVAADL